MTVYVSDPDFTLHVGDVSDVLATLPDESVHCCVTSPPYWGLRDYGTGTWDGGDPDCDHIRQSTVSRASSGLDGATDTQGGAVAYKTLCGRCGALRVDQQLGLEATPEEYVARMVAVFAEVRRVLRSDGTLWLNLGDSFSHGGNGSRDPVKWPKQSRNDHRVAHAKAAGGTRPKDMVGIPWRTAFALQADGWYLRSDIIWSKPNPMPESVADRPTKAHEYLFLLTKSARYFYDADAIREPHDPQYAQRRLTTTSKSRANGVIGGQPAHAGFAAYRSDVPSIQGHELGRNKRSVWEIATEAYPEAHFATFPQALVEPCVKAGCPGGGTVLDPFAGSGTTALVARKLGRKAVGIELNPEYAELAARRLGQQSLLAPEAAA